MNITVVAFAFSTLVLEVMFPAAPANAADIFLTCQVHTKGEYTSGSSDRQLFEIFERDEEWEFYIFNADDSTKVEVVQKELGGVAIGFWQDQVLRKNTRVIVNSNGIYVDSELDAGLHYKTEINRRSGSIFQSVQYPNKSALQNVRSKGKCENSDKKRF